MNPRSLPLALLLALAATGAGAEDFRTSNGVGHSLSPLATVTSEPALRQAMVAGERMLVDQLADVAKAEKARNASSGDVGGLAAKVKAEQAAVDRAKAAFEAQDRAYNDALAAFNQRQVDLDAETTRQRNEAATLQALPSAQREWAQVERLNKWADDIAKKRAGFATERDQLLAQHAAVELERQKVEKMRLDAEARLRQQRDGSVGAFGQSAAAVDAAYGQLQGGIKYVEQARNLMRTRYNKDPGPSSIFEQAKGRLGAWQAQRAGH
jgi:hypothetical protein